MYVIDEYRYWSQWMLDVASFHVCNDNVATSIAVNVDPSIDGVCFTVSDPIRIVSQDGICIRIVNVARKNCTPAISLVDVTCVDVPCTDKVTTFHSNANIISLVDVTNIDDIIANVAVNDNTNIHVRETIRIIAVTCIDADDASADTRDNVISVYYLTQHDITVSDNTTIRIIAVTCTVDSLLP